MRLPSRAASQRKGRWVTMASTTAAVMPGRKGQAMRKQNRTAAMVMRKSVSPDQSNALRGTCGAAGGACAPILLAEGSAAADGIGGGTDGISSIMEALSPPGAS